MVDLLRAYRDPASHAEELDMDKIVADEKVHDEGVGRYVEMLRSGRPVKPIIVVKHPRKDEYAVLNGHHRFWALREVGAGRVRAVVIRDMVGLGFHMTRNGHLQPPPGFTKHVRIPAKRLRAYLEEFWKDPEGMLREQLKKYR